MVVHGIPGALRAQAAATSSRSTSAWCSTAGWPTPRSRTRSATPRRSRAACSPPPARRLFDAVEQCRPGNRLGDVSHAVQTRVESDGFAVIRSLVGHGIGRDMHEDPQIPNFGDAGHRPGAGGGHGARDRADGQRGHAPRAHGPDNWAVYSQDGSLAAHFEHTVAVTADGPRILTPWHELVGNGVARGRGVGLTLLSSAHRLSNAPAPATLFGRRGAVSWAPRWSSFRYGPDSRSYEGPRLSQADVREVQGHPPWRCGSRDLSEPASQAASGVTGY